MENNRVLSFILSSAPAIAVTGALVHYSATSISPYLAGIEVIALWSLVTITQSFLLYNLLFKLLPKQVGVAFEPALSDQ